MYATIWLAFFISAAIPLSYSAQVAPRFDDYPVNKGYNGTFAPLRADTSLEQADVDVIKRVYEYRQKKEEGPNFAGRFIVITWACGAPCMKMAVVDAFDGTINFPPITWEQGLGGRNFFLPFLSYSEDTSRNAELKYQLDSKLFIITCNDGMRRRPYAFYFLWQQNRWKLLRKVSLRMRRE